jgi:hypothetical protein
MVSAATRKRRVASYIGAGIIPGQGGGVAYSWTPAQLNPAVWLDAADLTTIQATGSSVDRVVNKGSYGSASDGTQTGSARPSTGTRTLNGRNVLAANNGQPLIIAGSALNVFQQPHTVVEVIENDVTASLKYALAGSDGALKIAHVLQLGGVAGTAAWYTGSATPISRAGLTLNGAKILTTRAERVNAFGFIDMVNPASISNARVAVTLNALWWGKSPLSGTNGLTGSLAELLIFPRILSMDEQAQLEAYLAWKWGKSADIPAASIWKSSNPADVKKARNVVCWGDSFTQNAWLGSSQRYPAVLAQLSGRDVDNEGIGGQTSTQIRDRELADDKWFDRISIIWAGTNGPDAGSTVLADVTAMVNDRATDKFLVLPVINTADETVGTSGYNSKMAVNAQLLAAYPGNFFDVRSRVINDLQGPTGPYPNAAAVSQDIVQTSLRADNLHWTDVPMAYVAELLNAEITARAW